MIMIQKNKKDNNKNFKNEESIMEILSKPVDVPFVVKESEFNDFRNRKRGKDKKLKEILEKAKKIEENIIHKE